MHQFKWVGTAIMKQLYLGSAYNAAGGSGIAKGRFATYEAWRVRYELQATLRATSYESRATSYDPLRARAWQAPCFSRLPAALARRRLRNIGWSAKDNRS